jgi:hypothetical protein
MTTGRARVVFIHGLWLHATSWAPRVELFRDAGVAALVRHAQTARNIMVHMRDTDQLPDSAASSTRVGNLFRSSLGASRPGQDGPRHPRIW